MESEDLLQRIVLMVEAEARQHFSEKFRGKPKPPVEDQFKASFMTEAARRIRARAVKIEEDWAHFTRN